ncbi:von Willebrand factor A-like protein [Gracilaria domingensis]|nr:von Willebrand factor A-like protein [Gracilaria domingensis]
MPLCCRKGFSCGPVKLETGDNIEFVDPVVGQKYDFSLRFINEGSAVSVEDIFLLCDATGSMTSAIETAKTRFEQVVAERTDVSGDVRFGVGIFRDELELDDGFQNLAAITADTSSVYSAIDTITASGGLDADEANLVALYKVATEDSIGWRENSQKIVIYFGDFPGHEPSCVGGLTITRETVVERLNDKGITVVAVNFGSSVGELNRAPRGFGCGADSTLAPTGQADFITTETGGDVAETTDQTELINLINSLISNLPLTYESDTADCDGYITTSYNPNFPFELFPDEETTVIQTVQLLPGVCALPTDSFECEYRYTASGAGVPSTLVQVNGVKGC